MKTDEIDFLNNIRLKNKINTNILKENEKIIISDKIRKMQDTMRILFEKQKNAGGIIDLNADDIIILSVYKFILI
jgi:hypothetical protein